MEERMHIVEFDVWCPKCKYEACAGTEEPCDSCLEVSARENSHKPERWEAKD